jgi:hypothetical protein
VNDNGPEDYPHERELPENVIPHPSRASMDLPVQDVLRAAHRASLAAVVICGIRPDGTKFLATSAVDEQEVIYMLNRGLHEMNLICDEIDANTPRGKPPPKESA